MAMKVWLHAMQRRAGDQRALHAFLSYLLEKVNDNEFANSTS